MAVKYARETVEAAIESSCAMMGIQKLKEKQKDAITLFVDGNDVLVILPTGFGKSLCFALLPLVFDCQVMQVAKYCAGKRLARLGVRLLSASLALHASYYSARLLRLLPRTLHSYILHVAKYVCSLQLIKR